MVENKITADRAYRLAIGEEIFSAQDLLDDIYHIIEGAACANKLFVDYVFSSKLQEEDVSYILKDLRKADYKVKHYQNSYTQIFRISWNKKNKD